MNKKLKYTMYITTLLILTVGTGLVGYRLSDFTLDSTKTSTIDVAKVDTSKTINSEVSEGVEKKVKVSRVTEFIFETFYKDKDSTVKKIDAPYEYVGVDEETLEREFNEWKIVNFTEDEVYFKRTIATPDPMYVLTSEEDLLVVYYKDEEGNITLEEETGIYIGALPEADVNKIKQGIVYKNKSDVLNALQNYDS